MQQVWEEWSITSAGLNYCALPCIAKPTCTPKYMNSGKLTLKDKK